jgi:hypothetical protein
MTNSHPGGPKYAAQPQPGLVPGALRHGGSHP